MYYKTLKIDFLNLFVCPRPDFAILSTYNILFLSMMGLDALNMFKIYELKIVFHIQKNIDFSEKMFRKFSIKLRFVSSHIINSVFNHIIHV